MSWNGSGSGSSNRRGTPIAINTIVFVVTVMKLRLAQFVAVAAIFSIATGAFAETRSVSLGLGRKFRTRYRRLQGVLGHL